MTKTINVSENSTMGKFILQHKSSKKEYENMNKFFKEHMASWDDNVARCSVVGCKAIFIDESETWDEMCEICGDFIDSCGGCE